MHHSSNKDRIRLAVLVSHPIQYYVPVHKTLSDYPDIELKVFYTWGSPDAAVYDQGFNKKISWDIPLLDGYEYEFIPNTAKDPGTHHFTGLINPGLVDAILDWGPDIVLIYGYRYLSHCQAILEFNKKNIPILFRGDSHLLSPRPWYTRISRKVLLKWLFGKFSVIFYCGILNKSYFKAFGVENDRLFFCPHVVENDRFYDPGNNYTNESHKIRDSLGIKDTDRVILFAGKLQEKKSPGDLLQAFLDAGLENVKLVFAGDGELKPRLQELSIPCQDRVFFLPFQNQSSMPAIYRIADLFVLPSLHDETWGLSVNEAMCCGLPVIVSDQVGCHPDIVRQNINGWVFKAGDVAELTHLLQSAFADDNVDLKTMGMESREIIKGWNITEAAHCLYSGVKTVLLKNDQPAS